MPLSLTESMPPIATRISKTVTNNHVNVGLLSCLTGCEIRGYGHDGNVTIFSSMINQDGAKAHAQHNAEPPARHPAWCGPSQTLACPRKSQLRHPAWCGASS